MYTPRTMTVSQFEAEWECTPPGTDYQKWLNDFAKPNGVTIVPDPEPRPDFENMTNEQRYDWVCMNRGPYSDLHRWIRAQIDLCNEIADRKGMGR